MYRTMLRAKIHRARVTEVDVDYAGSCGIDADLLAAADVLGDEQVDVYNVTNGERLTTYAIPLPAGSGRVSLNGAAAHLAARGDRVIVCAYGLLADAEARRHAAVVIHVDGANRIREQRAERLPDRA